jgi:hypothetical protein
MELGKHYADISKVLKPLGYAAVVLLALALVYGVYRWNNRGTTRPTTKE